MSLDQAGWSWGVDPTLGGLALVMPADIGGMMMEWCTRVQGLGPKLEGPSDRRSEQMPTIDHVTYWVKWRLIPNSYCRR